MDIRPIRTEQDHKAALAEIEACWGARESSEEGDRLDVLLALVEIYEAKRWPTDLSKRFDPIDVLKLCHRRTRAHPGRTGRAVEVTIACIGNSLPPTPPHGRHDP